MKTVELNEQQWRDVVLALQNAAGCASDEGREVTAKSYEDAEAHIRWQATPFSIDKRMRAAAESCGDVNPSTEAAR